MDIFRLNDTFTRECNQQQTANMDALRFSLDGVVGTTIALGSVASNLLLFYVFSTSHKLRRQNYANPVLLALFDSLVSLCYIGVICVQAFVYRFESELLASAWISYVRELYCFQHICVTICNFLLVVASLERFCANSPEGKQKYVLMFTVRWKYAVVGGIIGLAVVLKGTLYFETTMLHLENCAPLERYVPALKWSAASQWASTRFLARKTLTVVLPFFVILYCNSQIVSQLRQRRKETKRASMKLAPGKEDMNGSLRQHYNEKKGVRVATRTLLLVVGCYLCSNTAATLINLAEFIDPIALERNFYSYLLVQDCSSLLTVVGCFCRLPIYCLSDRRIRNAVTRALLRLLHRARPLELPPGNLEKWSLVIVSNSLRSNLTAANNLFASHEWKNGRAQRTKDELAFLLQNRRRLLVDMTFRLGNIVPQERLVEESTTADFLSDAEAERQPCLGIREVLAEAEEEKHEGSEEDSLGTPQHSKGPTAHNGHV